MWLKAIKDYYLISSFFVVLSFIRSEKQIKVKGILNSLGVLTPEKINISKIYLFLEFGVIFDYSQPIAV